MGGAQRAEIFMVLLQNSISLTVPIIELCYKGVSDIFVSVLWVQAELWLNESLGSPVTKAESCSSVSHL